MQYLEIKIRIPQEFFETIIAELTAVDYDSFMELPDELYAYVDEKFFIEEELEKVLLKHLNKEQFLYSVSRLENKNWNEEWEKNFDPVIIDDRCVVKASFHQLDKAYLHEIIINPKMSFGTGHHETTHMMIQNQLDIDHKGKNVIDVGSGTGILAILAEKLGAVSVVAYDIEDWAFENLKENINLNDCSKIKVAQGVVAAIDFPLKAYDIIFANINKNVLLEEIPAYSSLLIKDGALLISGFYKDDIADLERICESVSLKRVNQRERNNWASLVYKKI